MKCRYVRALALVATWYLMLAPPAAKTKTGIRDVKAPLSQWKRFDSFKTEAQCQDDLNRFWRYGAKDPPLKALFDGAKCVADPDLHRKPR